MLTAILAVRNLFGEQHDLWAINESDDYLEEVRPDERQDAGADLRRIAGSQPRVPESLPDERPR